MKWLLFLVFATACATPGPTKTGETPKALPGKKLVIDSSPTDTAGMWAGLQKMKEKRGFSTETLENCLKNLTLAEVRYYSFGADGRVDTSKIHQGVLVCHRDLAADLKAIFEDLMLDKFPVQKVVPANKFPIKTDFDGWDDEQIMLANVTSVFNFRLKTDGKSLSMHAEGKAIDLNPLFNPYEKYFPDGKFVHPSGAFYDEKRPGTVLDDAAAHRFESRGWLWAGRWGNPVDWQHFQKSSRGKKYFLMRDNGLKNQLRIDETTGDVSIYNSAEMKERDRPEMKVFKEEIPVFEKLSRHCNGSNLLKIMQLKAGRRFSEIEKREFSGIETLAKRPAAELIFSAETPLPGNLKTEAVPGKELAGKRVALVPLAGSFLEGNFKLKTAQVAESQILAKSLAEKLETAGAEVFWKNQTGETLFEELQKFSPDFTLGLAVEKSGCENGPRQYFFTPGAFRQGGFSSPENRLHFLRFLTTDDLAKSQNLAAKLSARFFKNSKTPPPELPENLALKVVGGDVLGVFSFDHELLRRVGGGVCVSVLVCPENSQFENLGEAVLDFLLEK